MIGALPIAALLGLAAFAGVAGGWDALVARWERDCAWLRSVVWRFTPEPFDPRGPIAAIYAGYALLFVVLLFAFANPIAGLIIWAALLLIPRAVVNSKWEKRRKLMDKQLPAAVRSMSNGVASGLTLVQAIDRVAERAEEPLRTEFRIISNQWQHGADLVTAIEESKRRLDLPNFSLFSSALSINQQMGGNVVVTMDRLSNSIESIHEMQHEVYTATSEGRTNIKVLVVAPFAMLGIMSLMDYGGVVMLFTTGVGRTLLGVAAFLTITGILWAWKVVNSDV